MFRANGVVLHDVEGFLVSKKGIFIISKFILPTGVILDVHGLFQ